MRRYKRWKGRTLRDAWCLLGELGELARIAEHGPDRVARRVDVVRERGVVVLEQREHLHQQQLEGGAKLRQRGRPHPLVVFLEAPDEVVDLVLERELGQDADGVRVLQALLEGLEV